jgi:hypothetical protein
LFAHTGTTRRHDWILHPGGLIQQASPPTTYESTSTVPKAYTAQYLLCNIYFIVCNYHCITSLCLIFTYISNVTPTENEYDFIPVKRLQNRRIKRWLTHKQINSNATYKYALKNTQPDAMLDNDR